MAQHPADMMNERSLEQAIVWQADHSRRNDAPVTAHICLALLAVMRGRTATGRAIAAWPGKPVEDAMSLRLAGGLHHLHLTGAEQRLGAIYSGAVTDQAEVDAVVCAVVAEHDATLLPWLDGPPQTNEAGRSAGIMAGLLWLSSRVGPRFELNEIGCSAGANTMMERYAYDLCGVRLGPEGSPVLIKPEWRGPPPPAEKVEIVSIRGCDQAPIDLADAAQALRLKAYVWPENAARLARLDAVVALARAKAPDLTRADAADWVEALLGETQAEGATRVLYHSIVWQYIPQERREQITAGMDAAGARATTERPLAWIMLETNRATFRHELRVRYWPGGAEPALLGSAQAHGAWVEWGPMAR